MTTVISNEKSAYQTDSLPVPTDDKKLTARGFSPYMCEPIAGHPEGKDLLSALQLSPDDVAGYIEGAIAFEEVINDPKRGGVPLLQFRMMKAVMRQPSTRTGGSMTTAACKLGCGHELISGMQSSSEAKGESLADSWVAFATQSDILGVRTKENGGPAFAARAIDESIRAGKLSHKVPVINLGDGENEHITQGLGDMLLTQKRLGRLDGIVAAYVGAHDRYRAFHSDMILAAMLGQTVVAVECPAAPVPQNLAEILGDRLVRTNDLDEAMRYADELNIGRNPDEYEGEDAAEKARSHELNDFYRRCIVDIERLQLMRPNAIVKHPRPRRNELRPSVDNDPRMVDVKQMAIMIPMRMSIIARHMGVSIREAIGKQSRRERVIAQIMDALAVQDAA